MKKKGKTLLALTKEKDAQTGMEMRRECRRPKGLTCWAVAKDNRDVKHGRFGWPQVCQES
jgi:hypothetical protein